MDQRGRRRSCKPISAPGPWQLIFTGAYAGPSGYWYSASLSKAAPISLKRHGRLSLAVTPFLAISGGTVFPAAGKPDQIASIGGGVRFSMGDHVSGLIGYSRTIVHPAGHAKPQCSI